LILSVKDNGIGIAESDMEHIFEEFRQIDQTTTQSMVVLVWFAITKSLVNMMQGKITVESKLGQGSTFHVELPHMLGSRWSVAPKLICSLLLLHL